ncbi:hypothetical protein [Thomasclavelia cocleata]|uniref:hypothetical protein n=1 Tax=Thomasclavelia cocleata TaxID=69824 RepID=UPI0025700B0E|nr:hypothetical protein [Thomasclavelia cocleata]
MAKYSVEEKETIKKVKTYLKAIRTLNQEKKSLEIEYNDIPTLQAIKYSNETPGGYSKPKDEQITNQIIKRDLISKRLELFNDELDKFMPILYLLNTGQRNIISTFVTVRGYTEMINTLNDDFCISPSSYKRNFPDACLALDKYLDFNNPPNIERLNKEYFEYIKEFKKINKITD